MEASKLAEGEMKVVSPRGISVLLIKQKGEVFALRNRCAHMGCTLAGAILEGRTLQCTCHDWRFDIRTGEFHDAKEIAIPVYETRIDEGKISVRLDGE